MNRRREKSEPADAAQLERFKEAARALGCDEDEAAFDEKLKAIAQQKRTPELAGDRIVEKPKTGASRSISN